MPNNIIPLPDITTDLLPVLPQQFLVGSQMVQLLFTSFSDSRTYPLMSNTYHDGSYERSLIVDTNGSVVDGLPVPWLNAPQSLKIWRASMRVRGYTTSHALTKPLNILRDFWEDQMGYNNAATGLPVPLGFFFYNPFEQLPGQPVYSNYDPTGNEITGRHTAFFRGPWLETTNIRRTDVSLLMVEVA